ncbi:MAG: hypothetical protein QG632_776 [Candidatus Dependentiae bacterium]|nr:hypothetical protein [Candidatus Dependentiae bacterium]
MDYSVLLWLPISLYAIAPWPQVRTNYRRGDAVGLSHWMLFLRIFAVSSYTVYVYLLDLPLAHKLLYPVCLSGLIILAIQGYHYDNHRSAQRWLRFASDMPQIYRNGGMSDLTLSLVYGLPLPTILATARVTICYFIYLTQFFVYRQCGAALQDL